MSALVPTTAEQKVIAAAATGNVRDFNEEHPADTDPANGAAWGADRTVRAEFIRALALLEPPDWPVHAKGVRIDRAKITGNLDFEAATVSVPLSLTGCYVANPIIMQDAKTRTINLSGSRVPGITGDRATIDGSLLLRDGFHARGEVRLLGAKITGNLECGRGTFENQGGNALSCDRATVGGGVFLNDGFHAKGTVRLHGAKIVGILECRRGTFENEGGAALSCEGATVTGIVFLDDNFVAKGRVNLGHAAVGPLIDDGRSWPQAGNVVLDGFTYETFGGNAPVDSRRRLEWLKRQPLDHLKKDFRPQPFEQLVKVLRAMGHERDAREIAFQKQEFLRKSGRLGPLWHPIRLWNWVLSETVGHGYKPWRALVLALLVFGFGADIFRAADWQRLMVPAKERVYMSKAYVEQAELPPEYPKFEPLAYSLDVFLPIVDLHQESHWLPRTEGWGWGVWIYLWLHIGAGWVLTTLAVLGLSGVIKKD